MADTDLMVLEDARDAVFALEKAYRKALLSNNLDDMSAIETKLEEAENNLSSARLKLLQGAVITTDDDVAEMRRIKAEIDQAASTQTILQGAVKLIALLATFV